MISQNLFDETLLENQEVFDYTDDQAVKETVDELSQQQAQSNRLEHISLTHPLSLKGKRDRDLQKRFVDSLIIGGDETDGTTRCQKHIALATSILKGLQQQHQSPTSQERNSEGDEITEKKDDGDEDEKNSSKKRILLSLWYLILQSNLWTKVVDSVTGYNNDSVIIISLIDFVVALFPESSLLLHPLGHDLKRLISPFWFEEHLHFDDTTASIWYRLLDDSFASTNSINALSLLQLALNLCNGCEDNKKSFVKQGLVYCQQSGNKSGLELLVDCLNDGDRYSNSNIDNVDCDSCSTELSPFLLGRETCRLIAVLSKFQPLAEPKESSSASTAPGGGGGAPLVSSAHANVKEFQKTRVLPRLHRISKVCLQDLRQGKDTDDAVPENKTSELLYESLSALRAMAIDNDIVQNMIALGILDTVRDILEIVVHVATMTLFENRSPSNDTTKSSLLIMPSLSLSLATATLGLVRNLCANDEVKTTICKSSLPCILQVMQHYLNDGKIPESQYKNDKEQAQSNNNKKESRRTNGHAILEEHACGILAAMALRQPQNAHAMVENDGHVLIFQAMRAFPCKVTLQRQACLAVRNIASRLNDVDKTKILDAGAEDILLSIAGSHPASAEEAYAALRDLGLNPNIFKLDENGNATRSTTEVFGTVQSNFRPVYE